MVSSRHVLYCSAAPPAPKPRILKQPAKEQELKLPRGAARPYPEWPPAQRSYIPVCGRQHRKLVAEAFTGPHHEEETRTGGLGGVARHGGRPAGLVLTGWR